jgi:branched-chain amino acid transport system permease protein
MSPVVELVLQLIGIGVVLGAGYALVSLGLTLVFGIMRVVNFAHGEFYMLGAFVSYFVTSTLGLPYLPSLLVAALVVGAIGYALSAIVIARLVRKHDTAMLLATLGLSYLMMEGLQIFVSAEPRLIDTPYRDSIVMLGPLFFTSQQLVTVATSVVITAVLFWYVRFTTGGRLMQAVAQNRVGATVCGVNLKAVYNWTFAVGAALAAIAGCTIGATTAIYPSIGQAIVIKVFVVLILGGMGSIPGAILGGLLLGIVESLGGGLLSVEYKDVFGYLLLVVTLLVRPGGLMGKAPTR